MIKLPLRVFLPSKVSVSVSRSTLSLQCPETAGISQEKHSRKAEVCAGGQPSPGTEAAGRGGAGLPESRVSFTSLQSSGQISFSLPTSLQHPENMTPTLFTHSPLTSTVLKPLVVLLSAYFAIEAPGQLTTSPFSKHSHSSEVLRSPDPSLLPWKLLSVSFTLSSLLDSLFHSLSRLQLPRARTWAPPSLSQR